MSEWGLGQKLDVNAKNDEGDTPLHFAAVRGSLSVARLLLQSGANLNATNNKGESVSICATSLLFVYPNSGHLSYEFRFFN